MQKLKEELKEMESVFSGRMLKLRVDQVILPNGKETTREIVVHPGAVAVVPILEDGRIVIVEQYRYPINKVLLEIPAGKLDPGENPDNCAVRELSEETGYSSKTIKKITSIYTAPGFTEEIIHLYFAQDLSAGQQKTDEDEFINVRHFTRQQIAKMISEGLITDAKSIIGLYIAGIK